MKIWITGASSGVGLATGLQLLAAGHQVLGSSSKEHPPEAWTGEWLCWDMSKADLWPRIDAYIRSWAPDLVILNAGMGELGSVQATPIEHSQTLFEVNYWANVRIVQSLLPDWKSRNHGTMIVLGSIVTELHFPFKAQYSASKAALSAFFESLNHEIHDYNIRIHLLEPGWIRSAFHDRLLHNILVDEVDRPRLAPFLDFSKDHNKRYPDGLAVAQIIQNLIENPKAPKRIPVGPDAKIFYALLRPLPYSWRYALVRFLSRVRKS